MGENRKKYVVGVVNVAGSLSTVIEDEFAIGMPEDVEVVMAYAPLEKVSYAGLMGFLDALPGAVDQFMDRHPDVIVVPSMTGSAIKGHEIKNMLEQHSGVPVIVPSLEMVKYIKELGKKNVTIVSAFGVELGLLEQLFFKNHGIDVKNIVSVFDNVDGNRELLDTIDSQIILDKIKETDFSDAEVVIFDSPTYRLRPIIDEVRKHITQPLLTVNQVVILSTLKMLGLPIDAVPTTEFFT